MKSVVTAWKPCGVFLARVGGRQRLGWAVTLSLECCSSRSCAHHYLFILAPKRRPEQTSRIFLLQQEREDAAKLQPSANLCLYSHVLYFICKKGEKGLFEGKLLFSNFNTKEEILQGVQDTCRDLAHITSATGELCHSAGTAVEDTKECTKKHQKDKLSSPGHHHPAISSSAIIKTRLFCLSSVTCKRAF